MPAKGRSDPRPVDRSGRAGADIRQRRRSRLPRPRVSKTTLEQHHRNEPVRPCLSRRRQHQGGRARNRECCAAPETARHELGQRRRHRQVPGGRRRIEVRLVELGSRADAGDRREPGDWLPAPPPCTSSTTNTHPRRPRGKAASEPELSRVARGNLTPGLPRIPGETISRHRALVILIVEQAGQPRPMPSAQTSGDVVRQSPPAPDRGFMPASVCISFGSTAPSRC